MDIWVVLTSTIDLDSASATLFASEADAYAYAVEEGLDHMRSYDCDNPDNCSQSDSDSFEAILLLQKQGNLKDALLEYQDWNGEFDCESMYTIYVQKHEVEPASGSVELKPQRHSMLIGDVPCKVCGRNVNASESVCWFCGVPNPAIS